MFIFFMHKDGKWYSGKIVKQIGGEYIVGVSDQKKGPFTYYMDGRYYARVKVEK